MKRFLAFVAAGAICASATGCRGERYPDINIAPEVTDVSEEITEEHLQAEVVLRDKGDVTQGEEMMENKGEERVQIAVPEEISSLGYDSAYVIDHKSRICIPYFSGSYTFDEYITENIVGSTNSIYAFVYDYSSNFDHDIKSAKDRAEEKGAKIQEFTWGDFSVVSSTTKPYFWATEYYVNFNGKFGDGDNVKGAYISVTENRGDGDAACSDEVKSMITNIFKAE